jgi:DNA-directed RNA polymerase specialized sigma24 family protein
VNNAADSFSGIVVAATGVVSPSAILQGLELEDAIARVLNGLKEDYREAIILRQICGMSFADVAKELHRNSEATARKIFSRAVKKLEEGLSELVRDASRAGD